MTRQGLIKTTAPLGLVVLGAMTAAAATPTTSAKVSAELAELRHGALEVPIAGAVAGGGTFSGTVTINEFKARDGQVVAMGIVKGSLTTAAGTPAGTALAGPIAFPVQVSPGGQAASVRTDVTPQATCDILHLEIGAVTLNLLGLQVTTLPIGIDISGDSSGLLGQLICLILATLGNVLRLIDLLNLLLGLLTGLVGLI